jgi:hypothetical protein
VAKAFSIKNFLSPLSEENFERKIVKLLNEKIDKLKKA